MPQVRGGDFYPQCLERGSRSERAFLSTLAEMYVKGVSTRKVSGIIEQMCGFSVSSSQVSDAAKKLDEQLASWRNRALGKFCYLYLDARYEKVRHGGQVVDCAVLIASGVDEGGNRQILGVSVSLSEREVHWRHFLMDLVKRGLHGLQLIISDAHSGLKAAKQAVFPSVPWQRCQFHLQQNAQSYVPTQAMKQPVANKIRSIFDAENKTEALRLLGLAVTSYEKTAPRLANWLSDNLAEGLTCFDFPAHHWKKIRTNNLVERINKELKRRTRVIQVFPNEAACERLITSLLIEQSEAWLSGNSYLNMEDSS